MDGEEEAVIRSLLPAVLLLTSALWAQTPACTATGDLEIVPFQSKVFPAPRQLRILLPDGYRAPTNSNRRYPVLYLNDGQALFDVCVVGLSHEWRVDETVGELVAQGKLAPLIVVGIDNGGRRLRAKEYLPYVDRFLQPPEPDPQGKRYPKFLLDEVIPFVESRYRIMPGAKNRVLGGASYGAGIALHTLIARPESFAGLLLESPSVYADDYHLLKDAKRVRAWPERVYIGTGTVNEPVRDSERLRQLIEDAGLTRARLWRVQQEGGAHSERWWAQRLPAALQFLFPQEQ